MDMFGDFDDDIFTEQKPVREASSAVTLVQAEPDWFVESPAPEGLELLRLKFAADRLYRQKRYADAAVMYASSIEMCPSTNLGFLRDIVDGAARSLARWSTSSLCEDSNLVRAQCLERLRALEEMASCEDHRFSVASTRWLIEGRLDDLHTMIESEPHSATLWKMLGQRYRADGKDLFAMCCFIKAACNYRTSVHECKDRFRQENSAAARSTNEDIARMAATFGNSSQIIDRINNFYASLVDTTRQAEQTFEDYWFPSDDLLSL